MRSLNWLSLRIRRMFRRFVIAAIAFFTAIATYADVTLKGVVKDAVSGEPIPYASVVLKSMGWGRLTNEKGKFELSHTERADSLIVSAMGFASVRLPLDASQKTINVGLEPVGKQLGVVYVKPRKEKYSKKNNPAVDFVNRIRNSQDLTDPRRNDYYNFDKYQRITIALNNFNPTSDKNLILKKFDFLKEHIDTSEVSGRPILNFSSREKASTIHYRRDPKSEKEYISGVRQDGLDDFMDEENMRLLYENFFNDIELYNNDIYLLHNQFVSPLSRIAPDFYKFYLTDTVDVGKTPCVELTFVPRNSATSGFTGHVYVPVGDTTMFIKRVVMNVPAAINLNYIEQLYINQEFEKAPDGSRLLVRDDLTAEISLIPGTQGLYFRRNTAYGNHNFDRVDSVDVFAPLGSSIELDGYDIRDEEFWQQKRLIPMTRHEGSVGNLAGRLRSVPLYYWTEKFLKYMVMGYIGTSKNSKFDIGPLNTTISHNSLEGYRFRFGGMTTANLSKRIFARGYGAWGTKDHRWKYMGQLEYSFNDKKYHPREFPIHAVRATHSYDVDMLGQHYAFTNADNMFLSFKRQDDYQITYLRQSRLEYILELANNLSITAGITHRRQEATPYMPFITGAGVSYGHYNETGFELKLRFAPGEKFYQTKTDRISYTPEKPVIEFTHRYAPKRFCGNTFGVNVTELSVSKRFWFSAFGYLDAIAKGGHVWSRSAYPDLLIPNANLSYIIQPESFALMNPMEFINDSYASWELTYWGNGAILNYIPLLKKLKLREVFVFRGLFGHLSDKNNPQFDSNLYRFPEIAHTVQMGRKPYMEASVGLDNIFTILRVDYVWRLTYRDRPWIDKGGLRIALHFTF